MKTSINFNDIVAVINGTIGQVTDVTTLKQYDGCTQLRIDTTASDLSHRTLCIISDKIEQLGATLVDVRVQANRGCITLRYIFATNTLVLGSLPSLNEPDILNQYNQLKAKHPEAVLLFRVGDNYEVYDDDAYEVSRIIGLDLYKKGNNVPMAMFPHKSLDEFLPKLVRAGKRVAICEPLDKPKRKAKR